MSKKKILSILIIGLVVLGMVAFVVQNLQADCGSNYDWCVSWCNSHVSDINHWHDCFADCGIRYAKCLAK